MKAEHPGNKSFCWLLVLLCPFAHLVQNNVRPLTSLDAVDSPQLLASQKTSIRGLRASRGQRNSSTSSTFIHYPHRYSHLRKFAFFPELLPEDEPFLGLDSDRLPIESIRFIHPVSTLSFAGILPPDLSLEAPDLLRLYTVLKTKNIGDTERLDPTTLFFPAIRSSGKRTSCSMRLTSRIPCPVWLPHPTHLTRLLHGSRWFKRFKTQLSSRHLSHNSMPHRVVLRSCLALFTCCPSCGQPMAWYALVQTSCSLCGW